MYFYGTCMTFYSHAHETYEQFVKITTSLCYMYGHNVGLCWNNQIISFLVGTKMQHFSPTSPYPKLTITCHIKDDQNMKVIISQNEIPLQ
jgi:hypothetical protein